MFPPLRPTISHRVRRGSILVPIVVLLAVLPSAVTRSRTAEPVPPDPKPRTGDGAAVAPAAAVDDSAGAAVTVGESGERLLFCSSYGGPNWTTRNNRALQTVRSCNLTVPVDGVAYITATATGYLPSDDAGWAGRFQLAVGATPATLQADARTERSLYLPNDPDLPDDPDSQTSKTMATSLLIPLSAGSYAFGLLGRADLGEVRLSNPAISVVFVARTAADIASCGQTADSWTAAQGGNFESVVSCTINAARGGWVFVSATAAVLASGDPYEARFRVGSDLAGAPQSDRYINVYPVPLTNSGENMESSALLATPAGTHTFHLLSYRYAGTGTLSVRDPSLSVLFFPADSLSLYACGAAGANLVTVSATSFTPVISCRVELPRSAVAFVDSSTSASVGVVPNGPAQEYEGRARIGVDSAEGSVETERRFTVDAEPEPQFDGLPEGDGSDRAVATSIVVPLTRGAHDISLNVRRAVGTQPVRLYAPTLTVLVAGPRDARLLPLVTK